MDDEPPASAPPSLRGARPGYSARDWEHMKVEAEAIERARAAAANVSAAHQSNPSQPSSATTIQAAGHHSGAGSAQLPLPPRQGSSSPHSRSAPTTAAITQRQHATLPALSQSPAPDAPRGSADLKHSVDSKHGTTTAIGAGSTTGTAAGTTNRAPPMAARTYRAGSVEGAFANKIVVLTGMTTGYLARLVLEKLLRCTGGCPFRKIYLALPPGVLLDGDVAVHGPAYITHLLTADRLFDQVRKAYTTWYGAADAMHFLHSKLEVVVLADHATAEFDDRFSAQLRDELADLTAASLLAPPQQLGTSVTSPGLTDAPGAGGSGGSAALPSLLPARASVIRPPGVAASSSSAAPLIVLHCDESESAGAWSVVEDFPSIAAAAEHMKTLFPMGKPPVVAQSNASSAAAPQVASAAAAAPAAPPAPVHQRAASTSAAEALPAPGGGAPASPSLPPPPTPPPPPILTLHSSTTPPNTMPLTFDQLTRYNVLAPLALLCWSAHTTAAAATKVREQWHAITASAAAALSVVDPTAMAGAESLQPALTFMHVSSAYVASFRPSTASGSPGANASLLPVPERLWFQSSIPPVGTALPPRNSVGASAPPAPPVPATTTTRATQIPVGIKLGESLPFELLAFVRDLTRPGAPLISYYRALQARFRVPNAYVATKMLAEAVLTWAQHDLPTALSMLGMPPLPTPVPVLTTHLPQQQLHTPVSLPLLVPPSSSAAGIGPITMGEPPAASAASQAPASVPPASAGAGSAGIPPAGAPTAAGDVVKVEEPRSESPDPTATPRSPPPPARPASLPSPATAAAAGVIAVNQDHFALPTKKPHKAPVAATAKAATAAVASNPPIGTGDNSQPNPSQLLQAPVPIRPPANTAMPPPSNASPPTADSAGGASAPGINLLQSITQTEHFGAPPPLLRTSGRFAYGPAGAAEDNKHGGGDDPNGRCHSGVTVRLLMLRPTLVTCTYKDPETGWNGSAALAELIHTMARGAVAHLRGVSSTRMDVVPADAVVNLALAGVAYLDNPVNRIASDTGIVRDNTLVLHACSSPTQVTVGALLDAMSPLWWRAPLQPPPPPPQSAAAAGTGSASASHHQRADNRSGADRKHQSYPLRPIEWQQKWMVSDRCYGCRWWCNFTLPLCLRSICCSCTQSCRDTTALQTSIAAATDAWSSRWWYFLSREWSFDVAHATRVIAALPRIEQQRAFYLLSGQAIDFLKFSDYIAKNGAEYQHIQRDAIVQATALKHSNHLPHRYPHPHHLGRHSAKAPSLTMSRSDDDHHTGVDPHRLSYAHAAGDASAQLPQHSLHATPPPLQRLSESDSRPPSGSVGPPEHKVSTQLPAGGARGPFNSPLHHSVVPSPTPPQRLFQSAHQLPHQHTGSIGGGGGGAAGAHTVVDTPTPINPHSAAVVRPPHTGRGGGGDGDADEYTAGVPASPLTASGGGFAAPLPTSIMTGGGDDDDDRPHHQQHSAGSDSADSKAHGNSMAAQVYPNALNPKPHLSSSQTADPPSATSTGVSLGAAAAAAVTAAHRHGIGLGPGAGAGAADPAPAMPNASTRVSRTDSNSLNSPPPPPPSRRASAATDEN